MSSGSPVTQLISGDPTDPTYPPTTGGGDGSGGTAPPSNTGTINNDPYNPATGPKLVGCVSNPTTSGVLGGSVQRYEDLPSPPPASGTVYKVIGDQTSNFASYYVRSDGTAWDEAVAPGLKNSLDPLTMPWAIVRGTDGTFELAPFCWKPRQVGDNITNPAPAFVGKPIRDVFFYQNRLGFLADETAILSVAGDYGNFWRRTVLDYLDSDVLSVSASSTDVALLDYAVPFNDGIMLFSAQRQFSLSNGQAGTSAESIEINPVTDYSMAPGVRPAPLGNTAYFAAEEADDDGGTSATQLFEYTRLDGQDATEAADVSAHVPGFIPKGVSQIITAKSLKSVALIMARSDAEQEIYVYQFYWDGDRKIISAWRRWTINGGQVLSGTFLAGKLYLIVRRNDKAYLEYINLRVTATSAEQAHMIYLDQQATLTGTYDGATDLTTFTFPYEPTPALLRMVRTKTSATPESIIDGTKITVTGTTVTVQGDESAAPVTVGHAYRTAMKFSRQYPHDYQERPLTTGRLQLRTMSVTYSATPFFQAVVRPYGPDANIDEASRTKVYQITAQRVGESGSILGKLAYRTGSQQFSVGADAAQVEITLINDTPFASNFVSAEWEGVYANRDR